MTFLLIPPYLIFAFFVMRAVLKKQPSRKRKWRMGLLTAFLLYLPFGWDVILGRAVFYTLCATQGGVHVYQTVELGAEYFDEDGVPLFYDKNEFFKNMSLMNRYLGNKDIERSENTFLNISKTKYKIIDSWNNRVLGEYIKYAFFGGWLANSTPFLVVGESCPEKEALDDKLIELTKNVFVNGHIK